MERQKPMSEGATPQPATLIPLDRIQEDRRMFYDGAVAAAAKQCDFIKSARPQFDEFGNPQPPISPEVMNALQKAVGIAMILAPMPGEAKYVGRDPVSIEPKPPQGIDEIKSDLQILRMHDHGGETSKKRKRTKAG